MIYGIMMKSGDGITVDYDGDIKSLLQSIHDAEFLAFNVIENSVWGIGDNKTVEMSSMAIRASEVESIQYGERSE